MATILFTTNTTEKTYESTLASAFRDIAEGTATICNYAANPDILGMAGLYLPNHKTFWFAFMNNSDDPRWRTGFYRIVTMGEVDRAELTSILEDKSQLMHSECWHSNGNSHGLIQAYIQAYVNELGENDNYWPEHLQVKY